MEALELGTLVLASRGTLQSRVSRPVFQEDFKAEVKSIPIGRKTGLMTPRHHTSRSTLPPTHITGTPSSAQLLATCLI